MAGDPKYQYPYRWEEIGPLLFPDPTPQQARALSLLEQKDRDAEDHWGGAGGTSESLLGAFVSGGGATGVITTSSTTVTDILAIPIPADPSFNYYIDWRISGRTDWLGTASIEAAGTASFAEFPPGTGYEIYGYAYRGAQSPTAVDPGRFIMHGQRIEGPVPGPQLGTTVHLHHVYAFSAVSPTTVNSFITTEAFLFAIPI